MYGSRERPVYDTFSFVKQKQNKNEKQKQNKNENEKQNPYFNFFFFVIHYRFLFIYFFFIIHLQNEKHSSPSAVGFRTNELYSVIQKEMSKK